MRQKFKNSYKKFTKFVLNSPTKTRLKLRWNVASLVLMGGGVLIFGILGKFKDDLRKNAKICAKVLRNLWSFEKFVKF